MAFGPHGDGPVPLLHHLRRPRPDGEIRRIDYVGAPRPPNADLTADPTFGLSPLRVNFDGSASSDPDAGDTLTYLWDFGDGSTSETTSPTTSHTYTTEETYIATLSVQDDEGAESAPATVRIDAGNRAPGPDHRFALI